MEIEEDKVTLKILCVKQETIFTKIALQSRSEENKQLKIDEK